MIASLQGICWETHATASGAEIATQVFKNNVAKVRYASYILLLLLLLLFVFCCCFCYYLFVEYYISVDVFKNNVAKVRYALNLLLF